MLVLSRKVGERIWIGNEICVTVVRLTSGGVRLGIEAPSELPVIREELKVRQGGEALQAGLAGPSNRGDAQAVGSGLPESVSAPSGFPASSPGGVAPGSATASGSATTSGSATASGSATDRDAVRGLLEREHDSPE
ncbi:MAG: carbon storage regulator [Blastopirellula sp.]|nr:carbon storage regulator [Blastopirellula sp.]